MILVPAANKLPKLRGGLRKDVNSCSSRDFSIKSEGCFDFPSPPPGGTRCYKSSSDIKPAGRILLWRTMRLYQARKWNGSSPTNSSLVFHGSTLSSNRIATSADRLHKAQS